MAKNSLFKRGTLVLAVTVCHVGCDDDGEYPEPGPVSIPDPGPITIPTVAVNGPDPGPDPIPTIVVTGTPPTDNNLPPDIPTDPTPVVGPGGISVAVNTPGCTNPAGAQACMDTADSNKSQCQSTAYLSASVVSAAMHDIVLTALLQACQNKYGMDVNDCKAQFPGC